MKKNFTLAVALIIVLSCVFAVTASTTASPEATAETSVEAAAEAAAEAAVEAAAEAAVETTHVCQISDAAEQYHHYACDDCGNYQVVYHMPENLSVRVKNNFFHVLECKECGFAVTESHTYDALVGITCHQACIECGFEISVHTFTTAYDTTSHKEVCVECGYAEQAEKHVMMSNFFGNYHDSCCSSCGFTAEHHVGVTYSPVDATSCQATCSCGTTEVVTHYWDGFQCANCGYSLVSESTYALVDEIYHDGTSLRAGFVVNGQYHYVPVQEINCRYGDFVKISHDGNEISNVSVMIDALIIGREENWSEYISDEIVLDLEMADMTISNIEYSDEEVIVLFESGRSIDLVDDKYVVYEMLGHHMGCLTEGYAYVIFTDADITYFVRFY